MIVQYSIIQKTSSCGRVYPYLHQSQDDSDEAYSLSPIHCRSFIVGRHPDGRYTVSKGNGLSFSKHSFMYTPEMPSDVWGLLLKEDALRDFNCGQDVQSLGIKTNQMECVLELEYPVFIPQTEKTYNPVLLQYSVECPWRIADAPFAPREIIYDEVAKWHLFNKKDYRQEYLIAADLLIHNLRLMHDNGILHNALTYENLTWALELLDFELCHTPQHPYVQEDYLRHVPTLYDREVIDTYKLINYIAGVLQQKVDFNIVDSMFLEYGFDLRMFAAI